MNIKRPFLALVLSLCALASASGEKFPLEDRMTDPTLPILRLDPQGHSAVIRDIVFSPDGKELVTASEDKTIRVWDVVTGQQKRVIRGWLSSREQGKLYALAIDPTGRFLACGGWFEGYLDPSDFNGSAIRIIDYKTGRIIRTRTGQTKCIYSLRFSPDGRFLASGDGTGNVQFWRTGDWFAYRSMDKQHEGANHGLAFSPDGSRLASASQSGSIQVRSVPDPSDLESAKALLGRPLLLEKEDAHSAGLSEIVWSPDGKVFATAGSGDGVKVWNAKDLSPLGTLKAVDADSGDLSKVAFIDNSTLVCGGGYSEIHEGKRSYPIYLINIETKVERVYWGNTDTIQKIAVSPDGHTIASAGGIDHEVRLWDSRDLMTRNILSGNGSSVRAVAFDSSGEAILFGTRDAGESTLSGTPLKRRFSLSNGSISDRFSSPQERVILERNGARLAFSGKPLDRTLKVGNYSKTLPRAGDTIRACTYTPDGKYILIGSDYGLYRVDSKNLQISGEFIGHEGPVWSLSVSEDGKTLISGSDDQTIRLWDIEWDRDWYDLWYKNMYDYKYKYYGPSYVHNASPLLSLFIGRDEEWIAWTREGYYYCSLDGAKYAGCHFNREADENALFYSLEQFSSIFYRPDVIEKALGRVPMNLPSVAFEEPPPRITEFKINGEPIYDEGELTVSTDKSEFSIEIASACTIPLRLPELFHNGRVINQGRFKGPPQVKLAPDGESLTASYSFSVTSRDNRYKIYTVDARGFKSEAKTVRVLYTGRDAAPAFYKLGEKVAPPAPSGTLYVLAVGIDQYTNEEMAAAGMVNLSYAEKDAADMASLWTAQQGRLFDKVEARVLTKEAIGRDVKSADVLDALTALGKKATRDTDSVLIFLSGHGLRKDDGFFFLSSEADPTSKQTLVATSPSWLSIGDKLKAMTRAKEIVVLVDACHSGAINPTELGFTWKDKGVVLITSSRAGQRSYEGGSWVDELKRKSVFENGLFTAAIVEGFTRSAGGPDVAERAKVADERAPADSSQDDVLIVGEILSYAIDKVGKWTEGQQTPWAPAYDPAIEGKVMAVVR